MSNDGATLRSLLARARREHWAVPHINIADFTMLGAVAAAAAAEQAPLMVGASPGERAFLGDAVLARVVPIFAETYGAALFLNADHAKTVTSAIAAVDAGFPSVHIDLSAEPFEKNVAGTREVVEYARRRGLATAIEGEVGYLVTDASTVYQQRIVVPAESLATPDAAKAFVAATRVDRLAAAVGTIHGIAANTPLIAVNLVATISQAVGEIPLVLHGTSGANPDEVRAAIAAGIANVHYSTDIRLAYVQALRQSFAERPAEVTPYKLAAPVVEAVRRAVVEKISLCGAAGRI